ncbi:MAG: hypothetical protein ACKOZW_11575 [Cyanobium sp.]
MGCPWPFWRLALALALVMPLPVGAQAASPTPDTPEATVREKELLERIRELKAPRLRSYGACRYDWGAWRLNDRGVRSTSSECGEPAIRGTVAVYCETLQINRRVEEGPWEGWRLPHSADESPLLGGEYRLVASLCANVRQAGRGDRGDGAPPLGGGTPAKPGPPPIPASPSPHTSSKPSPSTKAASPASASPTKANPAKASPAKTAAP